MKTINEYLSSNENLINTNDEVAYTWSYDVSCDKYYIQDREWNNFEANYDESSNIISIK